MSRGHQRFYTLHVWAAAKKADPEAIVHVEDVPGTEHLPDRDRDYRFVVTSPSADAPLATLTTVAEARAFCHQHGVAV